MIDILTSEDMENISLYIFQYLTVYYIIKLFSFHMPWAARTQVRIQFLLQGCPQMKPVNRLCSHCLFYDYVDTASFPSAFTTAKIITITASYESPYHTKFMSRDEVYAGLC